MKKRLKDSKFAHLSFIAALSLFLGVSFAARSESLPFVTGSLSEILDSRQGKPVMLVFWSVDCGSCIKELNALGEIQRRNPGFPMVMVSTDGLNESKKVSDMLAQHDMRKVESWIFADSDKQRLRYEIDPTWYGELPRTYFYDREHNRTAVSGMLKSVTIYQWVASQSAS